MHFPAFNMVRYNVGGFVPFYNRIFERTKLKMKAYTAVQKKLLTIIYALWKKDQAFDPQHQWSIGSEKTGVDKEPVSSLATAPAVTREQAPQQQQGRQKEITPSNKDGVTQDRHPSTSRRMPSLATIKLPT